MDIRHLRYFLAIADSGSFTRAANDLGIAQPAISQALSRMEKELGVRLFVRSRRGAVLTPAGLAMVDDLRLSIAQIDAAALRASEIGAQRAGRLVIGFVSGALFETLPHAIRTLLKNMPDVELVMNQMSSVEQAIALERGEIDLGLLHTPVTINGRMHEKLIRRDPLVAVLPKEFRRQPDGAVRLRDLAQAGLVWFPHDQLPLMRACVLSAFHQAGHPVDIVLDVNSTLTIIACVAAGCGVSLLPASIHALAVDGVTYSPIRDGSALPHFELSAIWPARSRTTLADRFAALLPMADAGP